MRNRTSAAANARNRSTKSGFIGRSAEELPLLDRESPRQRHTFARWHSSPELGIMPVRLGIRGESPAGDAGASGSGAFGHAGIIAVVRAVSGAVGRNPDLPVSLSAVTGIRGRGAGASTESDGY